MRRGYTSYTYETLDPEKQTQPDTKEGLYLGREVPEDSEEARTWPLHGPNQWPDEVRSWSCLSLVGLGQGWHDGRVDAEIVLSLCGNVTAVIMTVRARRNR